jgi:EAL and modified HD-GYP domain-containing signal transduction protein
LDIFVARQPIFDVNKKTFGYELLYRSGNSSNFFTGVDGDEATSSVMINSFLVIGIKTLTGDRKAFVNFTKNLILKDVATLFPKEYLVVEILENIEPDKDIIEKCRKLKESGVTIALDDFVFSQKYEPLIELADIIKVDFMATSDKEKERLVKRYRGSDIKFLAEKVETNEEFQKGVELGYSYFQGYFFSKPTIVKSKDIPSNKLNCIHLIKVIDDIDPSFKNIAKIIEKDVSLSYEILKLVNSVAFSRGNKITSINQAVVMIGLKEIKKWAYLVVLRKMGEDKPSEVIKYSLVRAKFCELMAESLGQSNQSSEFFLMGMFSFIDVLMDRPIEELLDNLPLTSDVKETLLGKDSKMGLVYQIVKSFERGEWLRIWGLVQDLSLSEEDIAKTMYKSIEWANNLIDFADEVKAD